MFQEGQVIQSDMLLQGITFGTTRTGSAMVSLTIVLENGSSINAVSFDGVVVDTLQTVGLQQVEVKGVFDVQDYKGILNAKLTRIDAVYDASPERVNKYLASLPVAEIAKSLSASLKGVLSEKGLAIAKTMLQAHSKELKNAMASQYGGYHDGIRGGLLNHIRKLVRYTEIVLDEYGATFTESERDLVVLGILVHDLGKLIELENGAYGTKSIVPHTYWGIEILSKHKDQIEDKYGEMFYIELMAIILEHHGEYGEHPKTIYAYLVHVIDFLDSRVSGLKEVLDKRGEVDTVKFDGYHLKFNRYD